MTPLGEEARILVIMGCEAACRLAKDPLVDLSQNSRVCSQTGGDVATLQQEIDRPLEKPLKVISVDQLGQVGLVRGR